MLRQSCTALMLLLTAAVLTPPAATQTLPGCIEPPGNNAIADVIVGALEAARPLFLTGIPSLGVPPLDPLGPLPPIAFSIDNEALQLVGSVNDTQVMNLAQFVICQVNVSVGLTQELYVKFRLANFHIQGVYDLNGIAVSLFPIFGSGNYTLDTYESGFAGGATIVYNVLQDRLTIKDLMMDVFFEDLQLYLECILGCGDMADFVNKYLSEIGEAIFEAVWDAAEPILSTAIEDIINDALKNVSISELLPSQLEGELGNANNYMDMVLNNTAQLILDLGLDPAALPNRTVDLGSGAYADLVASSLSGLSTIRRSGTATVDTVVDWIFLYANVALGKIEACYPGVVHDGGSTDTFEVWLSLDIIDIYVTARGDVYNLILDLDQFVISELGPVDVEVQGLGLMGWLAESVSQAVVNIFLDDIQSLLTNEIKDALQTILNENPWPAP